MYDVPLSSAAASSSTFGARRASLPSGGGRARSATLDVSGLAAGPPPSPLLGPAEGRGGRPRSMSESGADEPSLLLPSGDFAPSGATAAGPESANPKLYAADDFEPPHKGCCSAEQMSFWQSVLTRLPAIHIVSNALMLYVIGPLYMYDFIAPIIVLLWFYGSLRFYRLWGFCAIGAQYLLENDSRNPHYWTDRSDELDAHNAKKRKDRLREVDERARAAFAPSAELAEQGFDTREQQRDVAAARRDSATRRGSVERASARGGGRQRRRTESDCANPHVPRARDRSCSDIPPIAADIVHVAIIPNYKEPLYKLKQTIDTLVTQSIAHRVIVVMGMEDRDDGAAQTALRLRFEYAGRLLGFYWTSHTLQEGEIPGKSSNLNWAARCLTMALRKHDVALDRVMLTVADADTFFHPNYFAMLSHKHIEEPNRDYTIWNSANTFAPNSLDVPAICSVRFMVISLGRLSELANPGACAPPAHLRPASRVGAAAAHPPPSSLSRPSPPLHSTPAGGNHFPFAVYSLPLTLAMRAGYWDPATIPEDWHMCIRVHFHTSQHVRCKPLWLATGSDCVATEHWWDSIKEAYYQSVRWSYGAVDYGYIITSIFSHWNVGAFRKLRLFLRAFEVHVLFPLMFMALSSAPLYSRCVRIAGRALRAVRRAAVRRAATQQRPPPTPLTRRLSLPPSLLLLLSLARSRRYEVRLTVPAWLDPTYVPRNVIGAPPPPARQLSVSFGQLQAALGLPTLFIHWFLICVFDYLCVRARRVREADARHRPPPP
jgi:hypothetical protein